MKKYMPTVHGVHWGFTLNFEGDAPDIEVLFQTYHEDVQYAIWQHEKVEHDHLQGYLQCKSRNMTLRQVKEVFAPYKPHLEKLKINKDGRKPWEYASKDESRVAGPWEYGIRIDRGSNKGKRLESCERSPERMALEDPDMFRMYLSVKKMKQFKEEWVPPIVLRPWQTRVEALIAEPAEDRRIIWVYGPTGGEGKTTYGKMLCQRGDFAYIDPSKYADMWEMYHQQGTEKHIVIDFHRACEIEHFYSFVEKAKNRAIPKLKYRSTFHFELNKIHVIVLSNKQPDLEKISADRMYVINCVDEDPRYWCVSHKVFMVNGVCMHCRGTVPTVSDSVIPP